MNINNLFQFGLIFFFYREVLGGRRSKGVEGVGVVDLHNGD